MTCTCEVVSPTPHQCPEHFGLRHNGKRLTSVSRIVGMWPQEPCSQCGMAFFSDHAPGCRVKANIDNAKERGIGVDELFSRWLAGTLTAIPADTREDVKQRTLALIEWWQKTHPTESDARSQVIVSDGTVGGILDVFDGYSNFIYDVKNTSEIAAYYPIQLGGYALCWQAQFGMMPRGVGVIHVTQKKDAPVSVKVVEFSLVECIADFKTARSFYDLVQRRTNGKFRKEEN